MRAKQQQIVAEDGGTRKCAAKQQRIVANDRGTCKEQGASANVQQTAMIVVEDGGQRKCVANSIDGREPNRGNALTQLMEFVVDGAPLKDD
jgi:hypothetical protein